MKNNWTNLTEALSQLPFLEDLNEIKRELDTLRPLSQEVEGRVMQKIRLEWNYHSNAIEGNKLTFGETYSFLMYGLTAKGKPLKDHLDIRGHNEAINFLISIIKDDRDLTEADIRDLHKMILVEPYQTKAQTADGQLTSKTILLGEYKKLPNHVKTSTGEIHYYANPEDVPVMMGDLVNWYNEARKNPKIHPSVLAAFFHHRFVAIHPFDDGNGRLGRILMNLILMKNDYPPAVVKLKERTDYYAVLAQADKNEYVPLIEFVAETILDSMNIYLKAAKGENIEDDGDLDKEITLFKASFEKTYKLKSEKYVLDVFNDVFLPIDKIAGVKFSSFDDLFLEFENHYKWSFLGRIDEFQDKGETYAIYEEPDETTFLPDLFDLVVERNFGNLDRLSVEYRWFDFVKSKQHIDFYTKLELVYNRTNFQIKYGNKELFESFYGEKIDDNVKLRVANEWVKMAFEELKNKISNEK